MKKIFVIVKRPDEMIGHIEVVTVASNLAIICNEEGRINMLPYNCDIAGISFVGTIIVAGFRKDEFADVPTDINEWARIWLIGGRKHGQKV